MDERAIAQELTRIAKSLVSVLDDMEKEILDYLYGHRTTTPYELHQQFKLDINDAVTIYDLMPTGFGPGGRGERWMLDQIRKILLRGGHGKSSLDGMPNVVARKTVNDLISRHTKGIFSDQSWEAVNKVWKILNAAAIDWHSVGSEYQKNDRGVPIRKEWKFEVEFLNNNGKQTTLYGTLIASGAGSVDSPLEKYDIIAYVS